MRTRLLTGFLLLMSIAIPVLATPVVTVDHPEYDFGSITLGRMVKHTFTVRNTGDATLEIFRVFASCGCATTDLVTNRLTPGQSMDLEVLVVADHGTSKDVSIRIYSNAPGADGQANDDRSDADFTLHVRGAITPKMDYELVPADLAYDLLVLIDLRDAAAYDANHLLGAIHIPVSSLMSSMAGLPRDLRYIAYDHAGEIADGSVQALASAGYLYAYYMKGGISRWAEVQDDRFMLYDAPLPTSTNVILTDTSGRSYDVGTVNSEYYLLMDVRDAASYASGHILGAVNFPAAQLSQWLDRIPRSTHVIVYDDDGGSASLTAYQTLLGRGANVDILLGGLEEWMFQYGDVYVTQR